MAIELEDDKSKLPDLELASVHPPQSAGTAPTAAIPQPPRPPGLPAAEDLDEDAPPPLGVDIASVPPPAGKVAPAAAAPRGPGPAGAKPAAPTSAARAPASPKPVAAPAVGDLAADVDLAVLRAVAAYPSAPTTALEAPIYAVRVLARRRELRAEVRRRQSDLAAAERARDEKLAELVTGLRARASDGPLAELFAPLGQLDSEAQAATGALESTIREQTEQHQALSAHLTEADAERGRLQASADEAAAEASRRWEERARAEAKLRRAEIELRAAHDAARLAAAPGAKFAPPEHAKAIRAAEVEQKARADELAPLVTAHDAAAAAADEALRQVHDIDRRIASLTDQRKRLEQAGRDRLARGQKGVERAAHTRLAAYADVGRAIVTSRPQEVGPQERAALAEAEALVEAKLREVERHLRAIDVCDEAALKRGVTMLAIAGGLLLVLLLAVLARAC